MTAAEMGTFIAETRKTKNMTQSALAQRLNVTSQAVSRWERGLGFPDIGTLLPLADALGIGIDELINAKRKDDDQFSTVTTIGSIQKTICIAIEQINSSKWRKMIRLEILFCMVGICVLLYTVLGDFAAWRLIQIYNEAYCANLEPQLHVPSIPWSIPFILIGLGSLITAIILMVFRLRSISKMVKSLNISG